MGLHAYVSYFVYRWQAKGRHGVHSPFVYDLTEHVLLNKEQLNRAYLVSCPDIPLKYENLICRIAAYYGFRQAFHLSPQAGAELKSPVDLVVVDGVNPREWIASFAGFVPFLKNESCVILTNIHKSAANTNAWKMICGEESVRMSIDIYGIGLLFFRSEFKEKQHFVLRY